jgi:hypothetical protein
MAFSSSWGTDKPGIAFMSGVQLDWANNVVGLPASANVLKTTAVTLGYLKDGPRILVQTANVFYNGTNGSPANVITHVANIHEFEGNAVIYGGITAANITTSGLVTAVGNVYGNYLIGNLACASGISTNKIFNGTSEAVIGTTNGNANISIGGTSNVVVVTTAGILVTGIVSASGNVDGLTVNTNAVVGTDFALTSTGNISLSATGNINVNNANINNVPTPVQAGDATNKAYVDNYVSGLNIQDAVKAATPANLATISGGTVTYNNGTLGVGANLVTTGTYTTIDSVNIASAGTRILVFNEANAATNGIYTYTSSTVLTRATDFDTVAEIEPGDFVFITNGSTYGNTGWVQTATITSVGSAGNNIVFSQFSGSGTYTAGTGLTLTGVSFSVNASQTQITSVGTLGSLSVTGNITGGNVISNGLISAVGSANVGNLYTGGLISAQGNITSGNLSVLGNVSGNTNGFTIGYLEIPQVTVSGSVAFGLTDSGKHFYSANTTHTLTIPPNSTTAFPVGTAITVIQEGTNALTIARGLGVTMYLVGNATSSNRTLSNFGMATVMKVGTDTWYINGVGLT